MSTYDEVSFKASLGPATRTATASGTAVDAGANGGMQEIVLVVATGTITDGSHAVKVQESDDGSTGWADVAAGNLQGSLPTVVAASDDTVFEVGVRPTKRYVRAVSTVTGATTGGLYAAAFILGRPRFKPVSHP